MLRDVVEQFELEDLYALHVQGVPVVYTDEELCDAIGNMVGLGVLHSPDSLGGDGALGSSHRLLDLGDVEERGGRGKIRRQERT